MAGTRMNRDVRRGIVLVHGLTGSPMEMRFLERRLERAGFVVEVPLLAGHGHGVAELVRTRWQDWAASVNASVLRLAATTDSVACVGICVGGMLALHAAASLPLQSVVALAPTLNYDGWSMPWYFRLAPVLPALWFIPAVRRMSFAEQPPYGIKCDRLRRRIEEGGFDGAIAEFPAAALKQSMQLFRAVERQLPHVRAPALLVHAREDDVASPRNAERVRRRLGGPVQVRYLDDSYHMVHVDRQRTEVADLVAGFCAGEQTAPAAPRAATAAEPAVSGATSEGCGAPAAGLP